MELIKNDYQKLKLVDLKLLCSERNIDCKETKEDMIKSLNLYDKGKYIFPTTQEKDGKNFVIGISLNNEDHLLKISKLIEKKEAYNLNKFCNDRVHYSSNQKLI